MNPNIDNMNENELNKLYVEDTEKLITINTVAQQTQQELNALRVRINQLKEQSSKK